MTGVTNTKHAGGARGRAGESKQEMRVFGLLDNRWEGYTAPARKLS